MIKLHDIELARDKLKHQLNRTPLLVAKSLSNDAREVRLKLETEQPIGAFKIRGASNAISNLNAEQLARGVVCASTGNHGRALAFAANKVGAKATVCMSSLVPENKIRAIAELGADICIHGNSQDQAQEKVDELVRDQGMTEIPPFDHADIIAGQGTIGLEILEDWPDVDTLIIGLSGGGLISGIALVAKSINKNIRVIGVSPKNCAAMAASLKANKPVEIEEKESIADSLGGGIGLNNRYTFELVRKLVDDVVLLEEKQIEAAITHLYLEENLVTEGAGAAGVSLLLEDALSHQLQKPLGKRIAVVISGGNIDEKQLKQIVKKTPPHF